jgi:hypothetical protein
VVSHIKRFVLEVGMFVWEGLGVGDGGVWELALVGSRVWELALVGSRVWSVGFVGDLVVVTKWQWSVCSRDCYPSWCMVVSARIC